MHPVQLLIAPQRHHGDAASLGRTRRDPAVIGAIVGAEPGPLECADLRRNGDQRIDELDVAQLIRHRAIDREQVANLMLRVVEREGHHVELMRDPEAMDQPVEQLIERARAQQLELALLSLAQHGIVARSLVGQSGKLGL